MNKFKKKQLHKAKVKAKKASRSKKPKKIINIDEASIMAEKITLEELQENIANILAGVSAQNGFRKTYTEASVRKHVTDAAVADALVAELNAGFDSADGKFDVAAKAESEEVDLPPSEDAGDLILDLFK